MLLDVNNNYTSNIFFYSLKTKSKWQQRITTKKYNVLGMRKTANT